ncbi:MAG: ABC transporter substrate-binding protein [Planctomycetota bacterium]
MKTPHWVLLSILLIVVGAGLLDARRHSPVVAATTWLSGGRSAEPTAQPDEIHISYWEKWTGFEGQAMKDTVAEFNRHGFKNAQGKRIVVDLLTQSDIVTKTLAAAAAGIPPDVAGSYSGNLASDADKGALKPLDDFCRQYDLGRKDYIPVYWDMCQFEGHTYALPSTPASVALFYNKDIFKVEGDRLRAAGLDPDRPPQTIDELNRYNRVLTHRDPDTGKYEVVGFMPSEPGWWTWSWGYWFGGKLLDADGNITATDPGNVAAYRWIQGIVQEYNATDLDTFRTSAGNFDSPRNPFIDGKVAMEMQGVWMVNFIAKYNPTMQFGVAPFPAAFDTHGQPVVECECDTLEIPHGARHPAEAFAFIHWVNTPEGMEYLCSRQGKHSPLRVQSPEFLAHNTNGYAKLFADLARSENAFSTPQTPIWAEYSQELSDAFSKLRHGLNDAHGQPYTPFSVLDEVEVDMQRRLKMVRAHHHPLGEE